MKTRYMQKPARPIAVSGPLGAPASPAARFAGAGVTLLAALSFSLLAADRGGPDRAILPAAPSPGRTATGKKTLPPPRPSPAPGGQDCAPSERLVVRLTEQVARARRVQPSLYRALRRLGGYFRISVDPYSGLSGEPALTRLVVGFARPDLAGYIRGRPPVRTSAADGLLRGVSDTRLALFMPARSRMSFPVALPAGGRYRLDLDLAVVPVGKPGPVRFTVSAELSPGNRVVLLSRQVARTERARWLPARVDLTPYAGKRFALAIETEGPRWAGAMVGRPEIWRVDACRSALNILLVILDTVRADAADPTGGRWNATPALARLAHKGTTFTRCYALATRTRPSMTAILSAEWLAKLGLTVGWDRMSRSARAVVYPRLARKLYTLHFRRLGYRTAAVGNNFFLVPHTGIGLDRGLDQVVDMRQPVLDAVGTVEAAKRFMEANRHRPFFLWVHFDGAHQPYTPPPGYAVRGARAPNAPWDRAFERYLGEVRWTDEQFGKLLEHVGRLGLDKKTVIAATADHGEVFSDRHNYWLEGHFTKHHHGWSAYEEVLHVPLVLAGPAVPKEKVIRTAVSHLDLMPTLAELAGLPVLQASRGRSLTPLILGPRPAPDRRAVSGPAGEARRAPGRPPVISQGRYQAAIRQGSLKYIYRWGTASRFVFRGAMRRLTDELYDLDRDPTESINLARHRKSDAANLRKRLFDALWDGRPPWSTRRGRSRNGRPVRPPQAVPVDVLHFRLWGGRTGRTHRLTVALKVDNPPELRSLAGHARVQWSTAADNFGMSLVLEAGPGRTSEASVALSAEPVGLELKLDGRPVEPGRVLAGPFGLGLLHRIDPLDRELRELVAGRTRPELPKTDEPRLSIWAFGLGASGPASGWTMPTAGQPVQQVQLLLEQWGYIHKTSR